MQIFLFAGTKRSWLKDMSNLKIELNSEGVKELLKSKEMMDICMSYANKSLSKLGEGYEVSSMTGKTRVNAEIRASTYEARKENLEKNTILKSLGR